MSNGDLNKVRQDFGYQIRRCCINYGIPLLNDIKCSKLMIESIYYYYHNSQTIDVSYDCRGDIVETGFDMTRTGTRILNNLMKLGTSNKMLPSVMENSLQCITISDKEQLQIKNKLLTTQIVFNDFHIFRCLIINAICWISSKK